MKATTPTSDRQARTKGWESLRDFDRDLDHARNWFDEFGPVGIEHARLIRDLDAVAWFKAPRSEVRKLLTRRSRQAMYDAALGATPTENIAPQPQATSRKATSS